MSAHVRRRRPVDEALAALAAGARPVAGGTDLVVGARQGKAPLPDALVAIHRARELRGIDRGAAGCAIGALVTHAEIVADPVSRERFTALADASAIVGSHATRAQGTIGGNVMNASPAMDTGAPLICFGATATLRVGRRARARCARRALTGPGTTIAAPTSCCRGRRCRPPRPGPAAPTCGSSTGARWRSPSSAPPPSSTLEGDDGRGRRIAITALAPTIHRVPEAEAALVGSDGGRGRRRGCGRRGGRRAAPISDVRGLGRLPPRHGAP